MYFKSIIFAILLVFGLSITQLAQAKGPKCYNHCCYIIPAECSGTKTCQVFLLSKKMLSTGKVDMLKSKKNVDELKVGDIITIHGKTHTIVEIGTNKGGKKYFQLD